MYSLANINNRLDLEKAYSFILYFFFLNIAFLSMAVGDSWCLVFQY